MSQPAAEPIRTLLREIVALGHSADPAGAALHAEAAALLDDPRADAARLRDLLRRVHAFAAARRPAPGFAPPAEDLFARAARLIGAEDAAPPPTGRPRRARRAADPVPSVAPAAA